MSYYHHQTLFDEGYRFTGEFEDFARLFREGLLNYGDYWSHLEVRSCLMLLMVSHLLANKDWVGIDSECSTTLIGH